jgi:23S rRNA pseudouridine1911/1915/1917 synthase
LEVIFENTRLLVVNKPAGTTVERSPHRAFTSVEDLAWAHLEQQRIKKPFLGVVHRLDRPVSGVLLFAKKPSVLKLLNRAFEERSVTKTYWAVVTGHPEPPTGTLEHWLLKTPGEKKAEVVRKGRAKAKQCILEYRVLKTVDRQSWLEVHPITGKYHQIRAQLSAMGCPIVGDRLYGSSTPLQSNCIALHARKLTIPNPEHPEESLTFEAEVPSFLPDQCDL